MGVEGTGLEGFVGQAMFLGGQHRFIYWGSRFARKAKGYDGYVLIEYRD